MSKTVWAVLAIAASVAWAQSPAPGLPPNYVLLLDNPQATVLRAHYGPHETVPVHNHPAYTTVFVYLNDSGTVRLNHIEGAKITPATRPPTHTGAFRIAPGHVERHSVENLAGVPADSVLVELKSLPADAFTQDFRGAAPQSLLTSTTVVFDSPSLRIERVICDPGATCTLDGRSAPSVLVAVSSSVILAGSKAEMLTPDQPASWLPSQVRAGIRSAGPVPAQVLRIMPLQ